MMIKKFLFLFAVAVLVGASLSSCTNNITYAQQLDDEQTLIADFIDRQQIQVVTIMPDEFPWPENVYYKSSTGLYFRLTNQGDTSSTYFLEANDLVVPRFIQYTLDEPADTVSNWSTIDFPYTTDFNYLDYNQVCSGWHEAASYMLYDNSEAKFIVYSKLGFSDNKNNVTPMGYDMKIRIRKD